MSQALDALHRRAGLIAADSVMRGSVALVEVAAQARQTSRFYQTSLDEDDMKETHILQGWQPT
jgi:hypothetical protein